MDTSGLDLVLASASPRRRELLERLGLKLRIVETAIDETPHEGEAADLYVKRMASEKLEACARQIEAAPAPCLAADTIVVLEGRVLGKAKDEDHARDMLGRLAGRRHDVITAYRVRLGERALDRAVRTAVTFRLLDPNEIAAYIASGEWVGKAGAYAIQGTAAAFVSEVRGSFTNVVGLPLAEVLADLRAVGGLPAYPPEVFPRSA